eukprot:COSAG03_NODE_7895_length_859_cov_0.660526_2_plen_95_part_00
MRTPTSDSLGHWSVLYWIPALLIALPIAPLCLSLLLCLSVRLLRLLIELLIAWSRYEKTVELERATRALQRAREVLAQVRSHFPSLPSISSCEN